MLDRKIAYHWKSQHEVEGKKNNNIFISLTRILSYVRLSQDGRVQITDYCIKYYRSCLWIRNV